VDPTGGHFFYSRRVADILGPLLPEFSAAALSPSDVLLQAA
jgi:hypothetical protein